MSVAVMRLERLADERSRIERNIEDALQRAEQEQRNLTDSETEMVNEWRAQRTNLDVEVGVLADDVEREQNARDISRIIRVGHEPPQEQTVENAATGQVVYRTFAAYARDQLIVRHPEIARLAVGAFGDATALQTAAQDRLSRAIEHTLSSDVAGLLPPQHMAQILDIINGSRPVVASARSVPLERGQLTYPKISQRPEVLLQTTEKTEAGTAGMAVTLESLNADTYLGGGNLSWQTINWSTPDALQLWFNLAAEAYARQTEAAACTELIGTSNSGTAGTVSPALGTAGTEDFAAWSAAILGGLSSIYATTAGRARTDTLYVSATRFFQLAGLSTNATLQMSAVGNLDVGAMTGTFRGLRIVGSYGFSDANTAILGDSGAFLVGETPGAPVEMRAVEPAIGGMEVGVIGAFKAKVFDTQRFIHLS